MKKHDEKESKPEFHVQDLKKAQSIYRALNHKQRIQIIRLLQANPGITVTALYHKMKVTQSTASQQLGILRRAGIIRFVRDKQTVHYFVEEEIIQRINCATQHLLRFKQDR